MGGHGLYASIGEYMKFIRVWLSDGAGPHGRVLKKETVEAAVRNGMEAHQSVVIAARRHRHPVERCRVLPRP